MGARYVLAIVWLSNYDHMCHLLDMVGLRLHPSLLAPYLTQVFIKGTAYGTGCWFSTDYLAADT